MEEKILEIINSKLHPMAGHSWLIGCDKTDNEESAKEIASHFREFASWINDEWKDLLELDIDELYNYWLTNIKTR